MQRSSLQRVMSDRQFQIGLMIWLDQPIAKLADLGVAAEAAGFGEIWVADHYFLRETYASMAILSQATQSVHIGTAVAAVQLRHPALIASSTATIDELSNGRAIIGIGPGGFEFSTQFGMHPKSPLTMMREAVTIMRDVLQGESRMQGKYFRAVGARLGWKSRAIPIHIAARGPAMTELAGEIADGVLIHGLNQEYIDYLRKLIQIGAQRGGRPADACEIGTIIDVDIDDDEAAAIERLRPRLRIMAGGTWSDSLIPIYKLDPQAVSRVKAAVSAGDSNAHTFVTDEMVRVFGIAGSRETVARELVRLRENGFRRVVLKFEGTIEETVNQIYSVKSIIAEVCQ